MVETNRKKEPPVVLEIMELDNAVDEFAVMMKARLHEKALQGWRGWDDSKKGLSNKSILASLQLDVATPTITERIAIDIANKAMFLWTRLFAKW